MALGLSNSLCGLLLLFLASLVAAQRSSTSLVVQAGRTAVLRCIREDGQMYDTNKYDTTIERVGGNFLTRGHTYTIQVTKRSDSGAYMCRIRNRSDNLEVSKNVINLNVVSENSGPSPNSASIQIVSKMSERLLIGGLIYRSCEVSDPNGGSWSYTWTTPDGKTTRTSIMYISDINLSHSGIYECTATSETGNTLKTRFIVKLKPDGRSPFPAQGSLTVSIRRLSIAKPVVLECQVQGGPPGATYSYEWRKDNRFVSKGQRLTLTKLQSSIAGVYSCTVKGIGSQYSHLQGVHFYNMRLLIKQTETKIALSPPPGATHVVEAGANKELHCELDQTQDRQEIASWFVSRDVSSAGMVPLTGNIFPTRSVSILVLTNMKKSDSGRYECTVVRNGRTIRRDAIVFVVQDVGLEVYPSTMTYIMGVTRSPPQFHCQVDNLPGGAKGITWTFVPGQRSSVQEQPLPRNAIATMKPGILSTSFLNIENPTISNYGFYVCRAPGGYTGRGALIVRRGATGRSSVRLIVKPGIVVTVDPGQTARVLCFEPSGVLNIVPNWRVPPAVQGQVTTEVQSQRQILLFRNVQPHHDGTQFVCYYRDAKHITVTIRVTASCPAGHRRCRSGTCIHGTLFCNSRRDCDDGSDEDRANCAKCEPNERECKYHNNRDPVKKCIPIHWICDGENDCGNDWDESQNCRTGVGCAKTLFQCDDGRRIPRGFLCDGENDCRRNDDESGCSVPRIVRPSGGRPQVRRANRGSEVRLVCEAIGKGTPKIVWRYNWGFVLAVHTIDERCVDPDTDISTLILSSVQVHDAGIYTCEALNNQGRAFGEDYVLEVNVR